jgi:hypothetical protein
MNKADNGDGDNTTIFSDALVVFIGIFLDRSADSNAWARELVTAVGLTVDNDGSLTFTVLFRGLPDDLRTLTARSVAIVSDDTFNAELAGESYTTAEVSDGSLVSDQAAVGNELEQLRINLGKPVAEQVNGRPSSAPPSAPLTILTPPSPTPSSAGTTTPAATALSTPSETTTTVAATTMTAETTTSAATTTATPSCDPDTATAGWVFSDLNDNCDTACRKLSTGGWTCDVNELHKIVTRDTLWAARNAVLDCDFPSGDYEVKTGYYLHTTAAYSFPYFPSFVNSGGTYYYMSTLNISTCSASSIDARRLCYCKAP